MKRFLLPLALLVFILMANSPLKALMIITPDDKTYVTTPYIYVVGRFENASPSHFTVSVNDLKSPKIYVKDPEYISQFKDFFIIDVELDEGENLIGITTYDDRKVIEEKKIIVYYIKEGMKTPKDVKRFNFHSQEKEKLCLECHKFEKEACLECHKTIIAKKYVHGPAGSGDCNICHNFEADSGGIKYSVAKNYNELCSDCHDNLTPQSFPHAHGPFAVGDCVSCHNLHSSDFPHQLRAEVNDLCSSCHTNFKDKNITHVIQRHPLSGKPDPSRPNKQLGCTSCHNPHGEKSGYFFVQGKMNRMEICSICHKK